MEKIIISVLVGLGLYFTLNSSGSCSTGSKVEPLVNDTIRSPESNYQKAQLGGQNWSTETIGWIENSRYNQNWGKYPPGFNLSSEAREVFDILEEKDLILTHKIIFEVMSMILCQYKFLQSKMCSDTMIEDRIKDLDALGYKRYNNKYRNKLKKIVGLTYDSASQSSLEFLLRGLTLIEDELDKLKNLYNYDSINKLINKFYLNYFTTVAKDC
jgi:hypothetical protein